MTILIQGFGSDFKVPMFAGETVFGAGAISLATITLKLLLVGLKTSAGSLTLDGTPQQIFSADDADTKAGAGSELARMCYIALRQPGVSIWAAAPTGAGGAAATATITIATTATSAGTFTYWFDGERVDVQVASGDTPTVIGASIVAAIGAKPRLPVTGSNSSGTVTVTVKSAGIRGNDYILFQDTSAGPSATTSAISGGSSVTGGGVRFTGGTGTETMTALLATIFGTRYHRIAIAQYDSTSLAAWKAQLNTLAGPLEGRMEHLVFATNGTLSASTTLTTTTLNNARVSGFWLLNGETHPSAMAAAYGALRVEKEQSDPDAAFDGDELLGVAPQRAVGDWSSLSTQQSALNNGTTPGVTTADGRVVVVRAITTKCLNGTDPDYRTLDTSQAVVPDYVRDGLKLIWDTEFKIENPRVASDPASGQRDRPAGVATPTRWNQRVTQYLRVLEGSTPDSPFAGRPVLVDVGTNLPSSEFDSNANRIMSAVPTKPAPNQHQIGVSVRQQS
jgi:phage tail sheath gpL-like